MKLKMQKLSFVYFVVQFPFLFFLVPKNSSRPQPYRSYSPLKAKTDPPVIMATVNGIPCSGNWLKANNINNTITSTKNIFKKICSTKKKKMLLMQLQQSAI